MVARVPEEPTPGSDRMGTHAPPLRVGSSGPSGRSRREPAVFYQALAADSAAQLAQYVDLAGATVLDVGGGPGYFRTRSRARGSSYFALDADVGELSGLGEIAPRTVIGSGMQLPFADETFDVCYSSNVLEHVPDPWLMADEMVRVTKRGRDRLPLLHRLVRPLGWPRDRALALPRRPARPASATGAGTAREPKNRFGESLFPRHGEGGPRLGATADRGRRPRRRPALQPAVRPLADARPGRP